MTEHTPHVPSDSTESDPIAVSLQRLAGKIQLISDAVKVLHQDRIQLETKIEDAQKRVQHILSTTYHVHVHQVKSLHVHNKL